MAEINGCYPMYSELSEESRETLRQITIENLNVEFKHEDGMRDTWTDDHCLCFNITINDIKLSIWWIDPEYFAACLYANESLKAAKKVMDILKDEESTYLDCLNNED